MCTACGDAVMSTATPHCPICDMVVPMSTAAARDGGVVDEAAHVLSKARTFAHQFQASAVVMAKALREVGDTGRELDEAMERTMASIDEAANQLREELERRRTAAIAIAAKSHEDRSKALRAQEDTLEVTIGQLEAAAAWCEQGAALPEDKVAEVTRRVDAAARMQGLCLTATVPCVPALLDVAVNTATVEAAVGAMFRVVCNEEQATEPRRVQLQKVANEPGPLNTRLAKLHELSDSMEFQKWPALWRCWGSHVQSLFAKPLEWRICVETAAERQKVVSGLTAVFQRAVVPRPEFCVEWLGVVHRMLRRIPEADLELIQKDFESNGGIVFVLRALTRLNTDSPDSVWEQVADIVSDLLRGGRRQALPTMVGDTVGMFAMVCGVMRANRTVFSAQRFGLVMFKYLAEWGRGVVPEPVQNAVAECVAANFDTPLFMTNPWSPSPSLQTLAWEVASALATGPEAPLGTSVSASDDCVHMLAEPRSQATLPTSPTERFLEGLLRWTERACPAGALAMGFSKDLVVRCWLPHTFAVLARVCCRHALSVFVAVFHTATPAQLRVTTGDPVGLQALCNWLTDASPPLAACTAADTLDSLLRIHPDTADVMIQMESAVAHVLKGVTLVNHRAPLSILQIISQRPAGAEIIARASWGFASMRAVYSATSTITPESTNKLFALLTYLQAHPTSRADAQANMWAHGWGSFPSRLVRFPAEVCIKACTLIGHMATSPILCQQLISGNVLTVLSKTNCHNGVVSQCSAHIHGAVRAVLASAVADRIIVRLEELDRVQEMMAFRESDPPALEQEARNTAKAIEAARDQTLLKDI